VTGPRKPVPSTEEPLPHPAPQLDDAPRPLPHFNRRCRAIFQQSARRAQGISVRPALDGVTGFNVIGMIQLVKAIVIHTAKRSASHQVTPMLPKRDAAQGMYPAAPPAVKNVLRVLPAPLARSRTKCGHPEKRCGAAAS
jgi:hypothetical protein